MPNLIRHMQAAQIHPNGEKKDDGMGADGKGPKRMLRLIAKMKDNETRRKSETDMQYQAKLAHPSPWTEPWYESKSKIYHREHIGEALIYFAFMCFYIPYTMRGLFESDAYYFMEGVHDEYIGVEMLPEHSPSWNKAYPDIANVEEYYHWLLGAFSHTTFSPSTFNGDGDWSFMNYPRTEASGKNMGYMHGYNKFIGAVRVGQIRALREECNENVPDALKGTDDEPIDYHCYGKWGQGALFGNSMFSDENASDFGTLYRRAYNSDGSPKNDFDITGQVTLPGFHSGASPGGFNSTLLLGFKQVLAARFGVSADQFKDVQPSDTADGDLLLVYTIGDASADAVAAAAAAADEIQADPLPFVTELSNRFTSSGLTVPAAFTSAVVSDTTGQPLHVNGLLPGQKGQPFYYNGTIGTTRKQINYTSVAEQRSKRYSSDTTKLWNTYKSPTHCITFDPAMGRDAAADLIRDMYHSDYIDLHTRAIFVDVNLYNPMLDNLLYARMAAEITHAGGVMTTETFEVVRMYSGHHPDDMMYYIFNGVVCLFYFYFVYDEFAQYKKNSGAGLSHFSEAKNVLQVMNIFFFLLASGIQFVIAGLLPTDVTVNGDVYNDFKPAVSFSNTVDGVRALNCFLNWFRLVTILNYVPEFGIMTETLSRAGKGVTGFLVIFLIVLMGFAQSYAIVFHARLKDFRTFGQVIFSLTRSLLGDFDYEELQDAHAYMGPFLFILFTALAVFVVLNMLIAIISDAYVAAVEFEKAQQPVYLIHEIKVYITEFLWTNNCIKCIGRPFLKFLDKRCVRNRWSLVRRAVMQGKTPDPEAKMHATVEEAMEQKKMQQRRDAQAEESLLLLKGISNHVNTIRAANAEAQATADLAGFVNNPTATGGAAPAGGGGGGLAGLMAKTKAVPSTPQPAAAAAAAASPTSPLGPMIAVPNFNGNDTTAMRPHDWLLSMRAELMGVTSALKTSQVSQTLMKQAQAREMEELRLAQQQVVTELKASVVGLQQLGGNAVKKTIYCQQEIIELKESVMRLTEQHTMLMQNFVNVTCNPGGNMSVMSPPGTAAMAPSSPAGPESPTPDMSALLNAPLAAANQAEMQGLTVMQQKLDEEKRMIEEEKRLLDQKMQDAKSEKARLEKMAAEQQAERQRLAEKDKLLADQNQEQIRLHQTIVQREQQVSEEKEKLLRLKEETSNAATQNALKQQTLVHQSQQVVQAQQQVQAIAQQQAQSPTKSPTAAAPTKSREEREKELQTKLTAFYSRFNPAKLKTDKGGLFVAKAAQMYLDKQDALNQGLRAQYGQDLTTFEGGGSDNNAPGTADLPTFVKPLK